MAEPFAILVVCLGNVCRSPLAAAILRMRFEDLHVSADVTVSSAGVLALVGHPMDESSATELRRLGGDPDGFASTQVTSAMVMDADLVITATTELKARLLEETPRGLRRTFTIREMADVVRSPAFAAADIADARALVATVASLRGAVEVDDYDVPDPIGRSAEVHHEVAELLDRDCTAIARAVSGTFTG